MTDSNFTIELVQQADYRVGRIRWTSATELKLLERALAQFEDFCVVTQSVHVAFPVHVRVLDNEGAVHKP